MATYDYFAITLSDGTYKRFKVIQFVPAIEKTGSIEKTINGRLDVVSGYTYKVMRYVVRVPLSDVHISSGSYGKYSDILAMYELSNPNDTPSSMFSLTDHFGVTHTNCYFPPGQFGPEFLTTQLEGWNAWAMIAIDIVIDNTG